MEYENQVVEYQDRLLIEDVDSTDCEQLLFTEEPFTAVIGITQIDADTPAEFTSKTVALANSSIAGNLCATLIAKPDVKTNSAVEAAITNLKYGTVAVNGWAALGFSLGATGWGDYQSYQVHNTYMLPSIEKSVIRCPFRMKPMQPWMQGQKKARQIAMQLVKQEYSPSLLRVFGMI